MTRRRLVLIVAAVALLWSAAVEWTGGFVIETPWRRISSRDAMRPLLLGVALLTFYGIGWRRHWADDVALARVRWPALLAGLATLATLVIGVTLRTTIAGGPDASGYVSQAALFVQGRLTIRSPAWTTEPPWYGVGWTAAPIGYRPTQQKDVMAPSYPPGLSLVMAASQIIAGPAAVFWVAPLAGALAVWGTFLLGRGVAGPWAGVMGAVLLACSPTFLAMFIQPMSDVPATACWTLALVAASRTAPVRAGLATALAVLIRPNLAPAVIVPALLLLLSPERPEHRVRRIVAFAATVAPAAAIIAGLNWYYFGSPLISGYGLLSDLYALERIVPNARQYGGWLLMTQTPVVALWLLTPLVRSDTADRFSFLLVTVGFPLVVLALYLPYLQFQAWEWWYLRFLMPAYPSVLIGLSAVIIHAARRVQNQALAFTIPAVVAVTVGWHGWKVTAAYEMLGRARSDKRYERAVDYVRRLPPEAVIISLSHSGTISLYTGRDVLRFELLRPSELDPAVASLHRLGRPVYFVGDGFEVDMMRMQFAGSATLAAFDAKPRADFGGAYAYLISGAGL